ncbi:MAG TPA: Yip1 family protein [Allosphingosinicella sp.]|jgi:hypothetical protein
MQDTPETPGTGGPDPLGGTPTPPPPAPTAAPASATAPPIGRTKGVFERARDIIMHPASEWPIIDREPATVGSVFVPYVLILAAIGPIAGLIGGQLFGMPLGFFTFKPPIGTAIGMAVMSYVVSIASVFILALIIDALAPSFGGTKNQAQAVKVAAYSWTAAWLAGIFGIVPMLAFLSLVGLYSFYLLYLGLPVLMKVPAEKAAGYTVVVILAAIVLWIVIAFVVARIMFSMFFGGMVPGIGG